MYHDGWQRLDACCIVTCARSASTILSVVASGGLSDSMIALITNSNINPNADCIICLNKKDS